jgi:anti-sigma regulatory factor (Ser/Thr protein kinase)
VLDRSKSRRDAVKTNPSTIRLQLGGRLEDRNVALQAVAEACKLVTPDPRGLLWTRFRSQVLSAVGEGFNNVVLHGKVDRKDGSIDLRIRTRRGHIRIELRDWGPGFDPKAVRPPVIETLPESGLGLHIMQSFMAMSYRAGRPNLLTLSKRLEERQGAARGKKREIRVAVAARAVGT